MSKRAQTVALVLGNTDDEDDHEVVVPPGGLGRDVSLGDDDDDDGGNALIRRIHAQPGDSFVTTGLIEVGPGLYSIVFCDGFDEDDVDLVPLTTSSFAPTGEEDDTWIFGPVYKDYQVRSEVGSVDIKTIVRQIPGPTEPPTLPWHPRSISWIDNTVFIEAWEPSIFTLSEEQDLEETPGTVEEGGSLAWSGGDSIYALRGDRSDDFWRYSISADSWTELTDAPGNVDDGGALTYADGVFYALRGDDNEDFWKFTP